MKHPSLICIKDFTYELPQDKIAHYPLEKRDESKLLVYKSGEDFVESQFKNISTFIEADSLLVFNNTRVIPARLNFLTDTNKPIEIFCLEPVGSADASMAMTARHSARWNCLVGNSKQWKQDILSQTKDNLALSVRIVDRRQQNVVVDFSWDPADLTFTEVLETMGAMPIPPYLNRKSEEADKTRYQTVYAKQEGSVAAPTAGLHFTQDVFETLKRKPIATAEVTLHVGAGTFLPVKSETMKHHEMHAEWIEVSAATIKQIISASARKIIAVGTTSLRTLESLYWMGVKASLAPGSNLAELEVGQWDAYDLDKSLMTTRESLSALLTWMDKHNFQKILCKTKILIAPPYKLKIADGIITNFHQPQSTLLLLISAVVGNSWKDIYDYALKNNFRFLSYGDSSLLFK